MCEAKLTSQRKSHPGPPVADLSCYMVVSSGLVRHELSLVNIDYPKDIPEAEKPPLPSTVLVHYFNPEVATEKEILRKVFRLDTRSRARSELVGVLSHFSSPEEGASSEHAPAAQLPLDATEPRLVDEVDMDGGSADLNVLAVNNVLAGEAVAPLTFPGTPPHPQLPFSDEQMSAEEAETFLDAILEDMDP